MLTFGFWCHFDHFSPAVPTSSSPVPVLNVSGLPHAQEFPLCPHSLKDPPKEQSGGVKSQHLGEEAIFR